MGMMQIRMAAECFSVAVRRQALFPQMFCMTSSSSLNSRAVEDGQFRQPLANAIELGSLQKESVRVS